MRRTASFLHQDRRYLYLTGLLLLSSPGELSVLAWKWVVSLLQRSSDVAHHLLSKQMALLAAVPCARALQPPSRTPYVMAPSHEGDLPVIIMLGEAANIIRRHDTHVTVV